MIPKESDGKYIAHNRRLSTLESSILDDTLGSLWKTRVTELLKEKGETVASMSRAIGYGDSTIRNWLKRRADPPLMALMQIAIFLDVPVWHFFVEDPEKVKEETIPREVAEVVHGLLDHMDTESLKAALEPFAAALSTSTTIKHVPPPGRRVRPPAPAHRKVPYYESIPAGPPEEIFDAEPEDWLDLGHPQDYGDPDNVFVVRVKGASMKNAGIVEGDMVIVEAEVDPKSGDIVIARSDGEWTLKRLIKRGRKFMLAAENEEHADVVPKSELVIGGVVRGVFRRFGR